MIEFALFMLINVTTSLVFVFGVIAINKYMRKL